VHRDNIGVYGIEKVCRQFNREGTKVGRDRIARLMDAMDLQTIVRGTRKRTTFPDEVSQPRLTGSSGTSPPRRRIGCRWRTWTGFV
jgi:hypothetical protein